MNSAVHGYYGKLPFFPEFLRLHASGPEIRWLDEWLQRGTLYAKAREAAQWHERVTNAIPYGFFYVPACDQRIVTGVLIASQDKAGRVFPFFSFVLLARDQLASAPWLIPVATATFLRATACSIRTLLRNRDWEAFHREAGQSPSEEYDPIWTRQMLAHLTPSPTDSEWRTTETDALDDQQWRKMMDIRKHLGATPWLQQGVSFPIFSTEVPTNFDLCILLQLCLLSEQSSWQPNAGLLCFWSRETSKDSGAALVSIGPGSPNVVRFIICPEANDEAWCTLTVPEQNSTLA